MFFELIMFYYVYGTLYGKMYFIYGKKIICNSQQTV